MIITIQSVVKRIVRPRVWRNLTYVQLYTCAQICLRRRVGNPRGPLSCRPQRRVLDTVLVRGSGHVRVVRHAVEQLLHFVLDLVETLRSLCRGSGPCAGEAEQSGRGGLLVDGVARDRIPKVVVLTAAVGRGRRQRGHRARDASYAPDGGHAQRLRRPVLLRFRFLHDGLGRGSQAQRRVDDVAVLVAREVRRRFALEERRERGLRIEVRRRRLGQLSKTQTVIEDIGFIEHNMIKIFYVHNVYSAIPYNGNAK